MSIFRVLFVDCETTGKCDMRLPYNEDTLKSGWPYVTQLSYTIKEYEDNFNKSRVIASNTMYFKPEYPESLYDPEALSVSGIQYQTLVDEGIPVREGLDGFISWLLQVDFVVAHNAIFDMKVIKAECLRHGIDTHMRIKPWVDTMYHGTEWMRSVGLTKTWFVKLEVLYKYLLGRVVDDAHKADADVKTMIMCFEELAHRHIITDDRMKARINKNQEQLK